MERVWLSCGYAICLGLFTACSPSGDEAIQPIDRSEVAPSSEVAPPIASQPEAAQVQETPVALPKDLPPPSRSIPQPSLEAIPAESSSQSPTVVSKSPDPRTICGQDHVYEDMKTSDYQIYICLDQQNQTVKNYRYVGIEKKSGSKVVLPAKTTGEYFALSYEAMNGDVTYRISTNPQSLQDAQLVVTQGNQELLSQKIEQREVILD